MLQITKVEVNNSNSIELSDRQQETILGGGVGSGLMGAGVGRLVGIGIAHQQQLPPKEADRVINDSTKAGFGVGIFTAPW
jgi:hypothetical protein